MDVVLIPAYEPDARLPELTQTLKSMGFSVLVVNDGSAAAYDEIFSAAAQHAVVIAHEKNRGKGAALKTGMIHILEHMPHCQTVITCDADGQHKPQDVERVRELLNKGEKFVLTQRGRNKHMPLRSKFGNHLSRVIYALLANRYLEDNQSGLRGFAREHLLWMTQVPKDNYDYEMNVLYFAAKKGIRIATIGIEAIYIDNNASSHFSPVADTIRIYRSLFYLARGSFLAFAVAQALLAVISFTVGYGYLLLTVPGVAAAYYLVNVLLNRFVVFRGIPCYDYWTTLIYTVIHNFVYLLGCLLFYYGLPAVPLWAAFNITYLICLPLRYFLHKFSYVAAKTKQ